MCCPQFSLNLEVDLENNPGSFEGLATNRKCTDVFGFIIVLLFFGAVIGLSAYCILNSDVKKVLNGYDDKGNICGRNNSKTDGSVENMEQKKYVFIKLDAVLGKKKECVENCTKKGTFLVSNYCVSDRTFIPYYIEIQENVIFYVIAMCLAAISVLCLHLNPFYHHTKLVWQAKYYFGVLPLALLMFFLIIALFGYSYQNYNYFIVYLTLAIIVAIFFVLTVTSFCIDQMSLKEELIHRLNEEVYKYVNIMTFWYLPLLSSIIITGFIIILIYLWIWLQSFSYLNETTLEYEQYPIATVTGALVIYAFILLYEIVKNCQCMIVSGYVAQWYFTRRDAEISNPMSRTIVNLLKYHLGTICFGSIILPIVYVLRAVVNGIKGAASGYNKESVYTCSCRLLSETCLATPITCLDFFSQNGFIITAMHGCSFCKGTSRAHKLISHNSFNLASIHTTGEFYLLFLKLIYIHFLILMILVIKSFNLVDNWKMYVYIAGRCVLLSYIVADCFISVLHVITDTIFLCFCEDCLHNNGTSKPYNMSPNFAQFVEEANKYVNAVKWKEIADKWEKGPKQLY